MIAITVQRENCFRVTIDTPEEGMEAWERAFFDLQSLESYLRSIAPEEGAEIEDLIGRSGSIGGAAATLEGVPKRDFCADGFAKLRPG
jgi:hypothetical protein